MTILSFLLLAVIICNTSLAFQNGIPRRASSVILHDFLHDSKSKIEVSRENQERDNAIDPPEQIRLFLLKSDLVLCFRVFLLVMQRM